MLEAAEVKEGSTIRHSLLQGSPSRECMAVVTDSEEVVTPLMLDGTYLSRNFATLGPSSLTAAV